MPPFLGDPRVVINPRGRYHVTIGDPVEIECFGYGFPVPTLKMKYPLGVKELAAGRISIAERRGYYKISFMASTMFSGKYTCHGKSSLGSKHDWVNIQGNVFHAKL